MADDSDWEVIPTCKPKAVSSKVLPVPAVCAPRPKTPSVALQLGGLVVPEFRPRFWGKACSAYPLPCGLPLPLANPRAVTDQPLSSCIGPPALGTLAGPQVVTASRRTSDTLRLKKPSESIWLLQQWELILGRLGSLSTVGSSLKSSQFAASHSARVLDQFAPSTLMKYFAVFLRFMDNLIALRLQLEHLNETSLADALVACSLSRKADPESGCGCTITIKAVRWISTHAGVDCLHVAWSPLVESFLKSRIPKELKEAAPLPLYVVFHLERRILQSNCSPSEVWLLGAILITLWGGLRFADAQRCSWESFVWDGKCLRASCWRTKTSHRGQPFGVWASGFLSIGARSWLWKWLSTLDQLWYLESTTDLNMLPPDFLFPKMTGMQIESPWSPMTYSEALFWIRHVCTIPWKAPPFAVANVTAHSMKSTLLSWGAQLSADGIVSPEERMLQGHHRQSHARSLRLYSRDDVFGQLTFQQKLIQAVRSGTRFRVPQHRGAQTPMSEPSLTMEYFRNELPSVDWKMFPFGEVSHSQPLPVTGNVIEIDSDSSSGSSSSSESSDGDAVEASRPRKKSRHNPAFSKADDQIFGSVSHVQHAMVFIEGESLPVWNHRSCTAACGMYLHPQRCMLSTSADSAKSLCQHRACQKAWSAWLS